jgi:GT2 family glycosyltransferase
VQGAPSKFAISVPVGAYHPLLETCLASLARQDAETSVAFLDASGDPRVAALADQYAELFTYRRHGPDGGQSAAILEGWGNLDGAILGWLNADDFLYPDALSRVAAQFAKNEKTDVVFGHSAICDESGALTGFHTAVHPDANRLRLGGSISQPSCLFKRAAFEAAGGLDLERHFTMDWDLWLRLLDNGATFDFVDASLSVVFWGEGTKTASFNAARRAELRSLIARYTPQEHRARVFRGFATQAALDLYFPAGLSEFLRRKIGRNPGVIFGISAGGVIRESANLTWFHLGSSPRNRLRIELRGQENLHVTADRPMCSVTADPEGVVVEFQPPVQSGEIVEISLVAKSQAVFRKAYWL